MKYFNLLFVVVAVITCRVTCDDSNSGIVQLCKRNIDLACVKNYFSKNSKCSPVQNPKNIVTVDENLPIYLPKIGLTVVTTKTILSQLDGAYKQFYLNKNTGNLVIVLDFSSKGIFCDAPGTIFAVAQNGKEPRVITEYVNATYPVRLVAEIPASDGVTAESLEKAEISAYFANTNAPIYIGPKFSQSDDPVIKSAFEGLLADLPTALKEIFSTKARYLFMANLQNTVCDFNLNNVLENYDLTVFDSVNQITKDDDSQTFEPCARSDDLTKCVRNYLAEQSSCSAVSQPKDEPFHRTKFVNQMPMINSSVILTRANLSGLNGEIKEFFVNKQTGNLVLSVAFDNIVMDTPLYHLRIHQKDQESKIISDKIKISYPVTITAVIPTSEGITSAALKNSYLSPDFRDQTRSEIGPKLLNSKDPQVQKILDDLQLEPNTFGKELFVTEGLSFFLAYLENYICDFGVGLSPFV